MSAAVSAQPSFGRIAEGYAGEFDAAVATGLPGLLVATPSGRTERLVSLLLPDDACEHRFAEACCLVRAGQVDAAAVALEKLLAQARKRFAESCAEQSAEAGF